MAYVEVPGVGRLWQCGSCLSGLETESGDVYEWSNALIAPDAARSRR